MDITCVQCYRLERMTTKETDAATRDAKPAEGETLVYIDWQGNRIYGKTNTPHGANKGTKSK